MEIAVCYKVLKKVKITGQYNYQKYGGSESYVR